MHQGGAKFMELIFCGKGDARAVLVMYKYFPYFCGFVGICFNLVCMWRRASFWVGKISGKDVEYAYVDIPTENADYLKYTKEFATYDGYA